ncbi:MAG: DUF2971 domain-containing protein [Bacteroidales bacterium]|nr:DUF2971 domain-containing protein [Bacteroidales bacterium]
MERLEFGNILNSVIIPEGTSPERIASMARPIRESIATMLPEGLFRFRNSEERHIEAFDNDAIYALTADQFNDPYDTLVRYDMAGIRRYVDSMMSVDGLGQLKSYLAKGNDLPDEAKMMLPESAWEEIKARIEAIDDMESLKERIDSSKKQVLSLITTIFPVLSAFSKRFSTIACFSEDVKSILMWSHYADSHRGFALEYDFRQTLTKPLEKGTLFPVVYSDERFDASVYITWELLRIMGVESRNPDITSAFKVALHKSRLWEYEREWRLIDPGPHDPIQPKPSVIHYRPVAIYYGERIPKDKMERLHEIAVAKGIREYKMAVDETALGYEMMWKEL